MMYGLAENGERSEAVPGASSFCPSCKAALIPKCGEIKVWHWSHKSVTDCDPWFEGETEWHMGWKRLIKPECCEVVMEKHRADIVVYGGMAGRLVVELQHSSISPETIRARESFYKNMLWLFDATAFAKNINFRAKFKNEAEEPEEDEQENLPIKKADYFTFRWKQPRQSLFHVKRPLFFDLSNVPYYHDNPLVFHVRKIYPEVPCGGWGVFITREEFIKKWLQRAIKE